MSKITSAAIVGIEAHCVDVEVDLGRGIPAFSTVGLPAEVVTESQIRIKSALGNCGFSFPQHRITVNLVPAHIRKTGSTLDLPIALGILVADGKIAPEALADTLVVGELFLDGRVRPIRGVLPMALMAAREGLRRVIVPRENAAEAAVVNDVEVIGVESLPEAIRGCRGVPMQTAWSASATAPTALELDMADVRGQAAAKRALEVAAVGGLNVLLVGPPGAGRTLLARRLPGILPAMTTKERLEVTSIHGVAGLLPTGCVLLDRRPFRAPHHSVSTAALFGGGAHSRPGEVTLAHRGVLFLDELPEFRRCVLDDLKVVWFNEHNDLYRPGGTVHLPASFQLVASMNPCPCGWRGHPRQACTCSAAAVRAYWDRVRPCLDLFDLFVEVQPLGTSELRDAPCGDSSAVVRERVVGARERLGRGTRPGSLVGSVIHCAVAALEGRSSVEEVHVMEAKSYRRLAEGVCL